MILHSKAGVLVIIGISLIVGLVIHGITAQQVYALHKKTEPSCQLSGPQSNPFGSITCCWVEYDEFNGAVLNSKYLCQDCYYFPNGDLAKCTPPEEQLTGGGPSHAISPPSAGGVLPPGNNNTSTLPPGSIIKVPPGTVGSATNASNSTGTPSLGNIIKVPGNHTNALPTGNNTSTPPPALKLFQPSQPSLAGQQQTTGHHHHKGGNTGASTSSGNSTGH